MADVVDIIRGLIDLVSVSIPLSIILLIGTTIGLFFFNYFQKRFQWKWLGAALASMVVVFAGLLFVFHLSNIYAAYSTTDTRLIPPDIRSSPLFGESQPNLVLLLVSALLQSAMASIIFSILFLPFAFAGVAVFDALHSRVKGVWPRMGMVCFLAAVASIVLLGLFPWILVSLVYLAFFGL